MESTTLVSGVATPFVSEALKEGGKTAKRSSDLAAILAHFDLKREDCSWIVGMPRTRISYAGRGSSAPRADHDATASLARDSRVDGTVLL
jgi:hypothetical protein